MRYYDPTTRRQRERSFERLAEARHFKAEVEHEIAKGTFIDPKTSQRRLRDVANSWLTRHPGTDRTKQVYEAALRIHILPEFGNRPLADVANDRDGVELWVRKAMPEKGVGVSTIRTAYIVLNAIVNDAVKAGRLGGSRLKGIKLPAPVHRTEIIFATHDQVNTLAHAMPEGFGGTVYLMRGCGLRIGEALGVQDSDFIDEGATLRVQRQLSADGKRFGPLKHRGIDGYRDVPVPLYVYDAWLATPRPVGHRAYHYWFARAKKAAGLPAGFTPHMLRHIYASNCLAGGVPITDVSKYLGHKSIQVTYGIYGHLVPASGERTRRVLDDEWSA